MSNATAPREITVRYFAWVREKVGASEERIVLPASVVTVADLIAWLQTRGDGYTSAFATPGVIRAALDHKHAKPDTEIGAAREIGFFPPVTGG